MKFLTIKLAQPNEAGIVYNLLNLDKLLSVTIHGTTTSGTLVTFLLEKNEYYSYTVMESGGMVVDILREEDPVLRQSKVSTTSNDAR
jgi:hypothetical protein